MDKMKKIANFVDLFLKAEQILLCIVAVPLGIASLFFFPAMFMAPSLSGFNSFEVGNITFKVTHGVLDADSGSGIPAIVLFIFLVGLFGIALWTISIQRKVISPMKAGEPFSEDVYQNMFKLAWLMLIGGIIISVSDFAGQYYVINVLDFPDKLMELFDKTKVLGYTIENTLDLSFLSNAAVHFMFAYIFKYGSLLQTQADETL